MGNISTPTLQSLIDILEQYGTPYTFINSQKLAAPFYSANSTYYDEYVNPNNCFTYSIDGTLANIPATLDANGNGTILPPITVQYPAFTYAWNNFTASQIDLREPIYTTTMAGNPAPNMWRLAAWDSGGERGFPTHDYFDFNLTLTKTGSYLVSFYTYDEEGLRSTELFQILDNSMTTLLASHQVTNPAWTNGVYETFNVTVSSAPSNIIVRVYNDAGQGLTINTVLSGVFLECNTPTNVGNGTACGLTPGFWKTNAGKDLGLLPGVGIQVNRTTYFSLLNALVAAYPNLTALFGITGGNNASLLKAYTILGGNTPAATAAMKNLLTFLLTAYWQPNYSIAMYLGHPIVPYWTDYAINQYNLGNFTAVNSLLTILNNDTYCLPFTLTR